MNGYYYGNFLENYVSNKLTSSQCTATSCGLKGKVIAHVVGRHLWSPKIYRFSIIKLLKTVKTDVSAITSHDVLGINFIHFTPDTISIISLKYCRIFFRLLGAMDIEKSFSDNTPVGLVEVCGKYYAMTETPFMNQIDINTLETIERVNVNKILSCMTQSPHPLKGHDGSTYTVAMTVGMMGPKYSIIKFPKEGNLKEGKVMASVPARWRMSPSYMHTFAMTDNYIILIEQPLAASVTGMVSDIANNAPFIDGLRWHEEPCFIHVVDRRSWKLVKSRYVTDTFFFIHIANAYEDNDHIVLDLPTYKDASILHKMYLDILKDPAKTNVAGFDESFRGYLHRFVLPLNTKGSTGENLVTLKDTKCTATAGSGNDVNVKGVKIYENSLENISINQNNFGKKYQYVYGNSLDYSLQDCSILGKIDVTTGKCTKFIKDHYYVGQPLFISNPDSKVEDDGIVLTHYLDNTDHHEGGLLILDAATMTEIATASVKVKGCIPNTLHGTFIPQ
ncbi:unnamed protein product, partial [Meganyctiphanes norvegica]